MSLFVILKVPAILSPYIPQGTEPRRQMPASAGGHLQGTLQEGHHGSAGQGRRRRDPGEAPHGKPRV
ncbi:unnamed protein product [Staurois parvus]|uniref:Uncharacterized protein n=1 Tax=Staurois parvus TaxID=386267 RepID=A0ABN9CJP7_9NEOB|nr:unnamed protein product [Staurois parvus]